MEWRKEITLGAKQKEFMWSYNQKEGITIKRIFKTEEIETNFNNEDLKKIINYIRREGGVELANNIKKLSDGTEKNGLGTYIYKEVSNNLKDALAASQLVAVLKAVKVLDYNGVKRGMKFYLVEEGWQRILLNHSL